MPQIFAQKGFVLNEKKRSQLASILIEAGYEVYMGKEKKIGASSVRHFVNFKEKAPTDGNQ